MDRIRKAQQARKLRRRHRGGPGRRGRRIVEPWSSGQVECKINRLKLIKRQMYGRANLDLLKARLMARA